MPLNLDFWFEGLVVSLLRELETWGEKRKSGKRGGVAIEARIQALKLLSSSSK